VKIGDFENSKFIKSGGTEHVQAFSKINEDGGSDKLIAGTLHWMAPEIMAGEVYGRKADIW